MKNQVLGGILAAAFCIMSAGIAHADAQLSAPKGTVLVNQGKGWHPVTGAVSLKTNDRVMISPNAQATLRFDKGCSIPVKPGQVLTIGSGNPCNVKAAAPELGLTPGLIAAGIAIGVPVIAACVFDVICGDDDSSP